VNADAKIQMMAIDGKGALAGEMTVEGSLPVATQLAGALASVQGKPLAANDASASTPVHADMVDLAAKNITFNNASISAMNSITARANTIVVQNSFMTVVRNSGMINMYVQSGRANPFYGQEAQGYANFIGRNVFQIGNNQIVLNGSYSNDQGINQLGVNVLDISHNGGVPVQGKVNILQL
jgi:hypothetical protein